MNDNMEVRKAVFSDDRAYRYTLSIIWNPDLPLCQFIGLNPSTADEVKDDPTIRRCKAFARGWGHGGLLMTNLFAYRATLPKDMMRHPKPIGEEGVYVREADTEFVNANDYWLHACRVRSGLTVAAWGKDGTHLNRAYNVAKLIPDLKCLGRCKNGQPFHPLYLPADTQLQDYALT